MKSDPRVSKIKTVEDYRGQGWRHRPLRNEVLSSILNEQRKDPRILRGRCSGVIYMGPELPRDDKAADTDL